MSVVHPLKMLLRRLAPYLSRTFSLNRPVLQADDHKKLIDKWAESLEGNSVPEVKSALDNILGHILQTKLVSNAHSTSYLCSLTE